MTKTSLSLLATVLLAGQITFPGYAAESDATTPAPRSTPTNWVSRHEGFLKQAKEGSYDLVFLGDSITDNWRSRGSNAWNKYYAPQKALNLGIGGDRTQHVLWRIEQGELDGLNPKVLVLMIGTNNSRTNSADEIAAGVEKIVQAVRSKCSKSKVLLLAIFPRNKPDDTEKQLETIKQVNAKIAKLDDGRMVRFLDINAKFVGPDGKVPAEIMPDFLHPNAHGYEIWAEAIESTLAAMMK